MPGRLVHGFAVVIGGIALEEDARYVSGVFLRHVEPLALARGLIIGHRAFVHVAHVVEFVTVQHP